MTLGAYRWFLQPVDVTCFGLLHFLVGLTVGWIIDHQIFGALSPRDLMQLRQHSTGTMLRQWGLVMLQMVVVILSANYLRKGLLLLRPKYGNAAYEHAPVPAMDGGFSMGFAFAITQQNLIRRVALLLNMES